MKLVFSGQNNADEITQNNQSSALDILKKDVLVVKSIRHNLKK